MGWPTDVTGAPLERVLKMVPAPGEGEDFDLIECQLCGCLIGGLGGHDPYCADTARRYLDWALYELARIREASDLPRVPRNALDLIREAEDPRSVSTPGHRRRMARAFNALFDESVHG